LPESRGDHFGPGAIGSLVLVRLVAEAAAATAFGASTLELETHPVASKEDQGFFKSDGNLLNKGETYQDFLYK